jgi:hypothetical protein
MAPILRAAQSMIELTLPPHLKTSVPQTSGL